MASKPLPSDEPPKETVLPRRLVSHAEPAAMDKINKILLELPDEARERVLNWINAVHSFSYPGCATPPKTEGATP